MPKFNTNQTKEVSEYINHQRLDLARLSQDTYTVKMQYQCLRMQELEMMRALVEDEYEETQVSLNQTKCEIGQIRKQLYHSGGIIACRGIEHTYLFNDAVPQTSGFDRFSTPDSFVHSSPPSPVPDQVN